MMPKRRPSSRRSEALHREAFAAAFVREFYDSRKFFDENPQFQHVGKGAWDSAIVVVTVTGEGAYHVADLAVAEYEKWRKGDAR